MIYDFYADPGHGWLKVQIQELVSLGIAEKISGCSYMKKGFAYLEEDGDLSMFFKAKGFTDFDKVCRTHTARVNFSKIRNYESYDYSLYVSLLKVIKQYDSNVIFNKWVNTVLNEKSDTRYFSGLKNYESLSNNAKSWFHNIVKNIKDEIIKAVNHKLEYLRACDNNNALKKFIDEAELEKQTLEKMELLK